jgi:hypothetical protein
VSCRLRGRGDAAAAHLRRSNNRIADVIDQWLAPDHRYFKLRGTDGASYIIRHDGAAGCWELVMFDGPCAETGMKRRLAAREALGIPPGKKNHLQDSS